MAGHGNISGSERLVELATELPLTYESLWGWLREELEFIRDVKKRVKRGDQPDDPDTLRRIEHVYLTFQAYYLAFFVKGIETLSLEDCYDLYSAAFDPYLSGFERPHPSDFEKPHPSDFEKPHPPGSEEPYSPLTSFLDAGHPNRLEMRLQELREVTVRTRILVLLSQREDAAILDAVEERAEALRLQFAEGTLDEAMSMHHCDIVCCRRNGEDATDLRESLYRLLNRSDLFANFLLDENLWNEIEESIEAEQPAPHPARPSEPPRLDSLQSQRLTSFTSAEDLAEALADSLKAAERTKGVLLSPNGEVAEVECALRGAAAYLWGDKLYERVAHAFRCRFDKELPNLPHDCFRAVLFRLSSDAEGSLILAPKSGPFGLRLDEVKVGWRNAIWNLGISQDEGL